MPAGTPQVKPWGSGPWRGSSQAYQAFAGQQAVMSGLGHRGIIGGAQGVHSGCCCMHECCSCGFAALKKNKGCTSSGQLTRLTACANYGNLFHISKYTADQCQWGSMRSYTGNLQTHCAMIKQQQWQQQQQASKLCSDVKPGHSAVAGKPDSLWYDDTATEQNCSKGSHQALHAVHMLKETLGHDHS